MAEIGFKTKYRIPFYSIGGVEGNVLFQKDSYLGDITDLTLMENGLKISTKLKDWFDPILAQSCTIRIINNNDTFWGISDLFAADEKEWKVIIEGTDGEGTSVRLFDGWIDSEATTVRYLENSEIELSASNYLSKLKDYYPPILDQEGDLAIINYIDDCFRMTEKDCSIYVNMNLDPSIEAGSITSTHGTFNRIGINTQQYKEDNFNKEGALGVLESLLLPFNSYSYYWDDIWWIERYTDLAPSSTGTKLFKTYIPDTSYGWDETNTYKYIPDVSYNLSDFDMTSYSQKMKIDPGLNKIIITKNVKEFINLTVNDFTSPSYPGSIVTYTENDDPTYALPKIREWQQYRKANDPYKFAYAGWWTAGWWGLQGPKWPIKGISNPVQRVGVPQDADGTIENCPLLVTRFKGTVTNTTVDSSGVSTGTELNIKYKWAPNYADTPFYHPDKEYEYYHKWTLCGVKYVDRTQAYSHKIYIVWDEDEEIWKTHLYTGRGYETNETVTNGSDLNPVSLVSDVEISIPMGDVSAGFRNLEDYNDWIFCMLPERVYTDGTSYGWPYSAHYGDFVITMDNVKADNVIEGQINNNVLKEKKIDLKVSDVPTWNSTSGFVVTDPCTWEKTDQWVEHSDPIDESHELADWLIKDRFKLYGKFRKKIKTDIRSNRFYKPFTMVYDDSDPSLLQYVLTGYTYNPTIDKYSVELWEYSNDEITIS